MDGAGAGVGFVSGVNDRRELVAAAGKGSWCRAGLTLTDDDDTGDKEAARGCPSAGACCCCGCGSSCLKPPTTPGARIPFRDPCTGDGRATAAAPAAVGSGGAVTGGAATADRSAAPAGGAGSGGGDAREVVAAAAAGGGATVDASGATRMSRSFAGAAAAAAEEEAAAVSLPAAGAWCSDRCSVRRAIVSLGSGVSFGTAPCTARSLSNVLNMAISFAEQSQYEVKESRA